MILPVKSGKVGKMSKFKPVISIITTLYNYKNYLPRLADSIVMQGFDAYEWIIVDDCSTDCPEIVFKYIEKLIPQESLKIIRLSQNMGYSFAKNMGLKNASGDYFVMIDADDCLTEDSLEKRLKCLQNSDRLWCHGYVFPFTDDEHHFNVCEEYPTKQIKYMIEYGKDHDLSKEYHHRIIHAQSIMVKRRFHNVVGLYDESLRFSSDNELFRRAIAIGIIPEYIDVLVALYRTHSKRMSKSKFKKDNLFNIKKYIKHRIDMIQATGKLPDDIQLLG